MPQGDKETYALWAASSGGIYYLFPTSYGRKAPVTNDAGVANGTYQFAIAVTRPNDVLVGDGEHEALTLGAAVHYAGTIKFSNGLLDWWNNDTGHYRPEPLYAPQALRIPADDMAGGLLPLAKFVPCL